MIAKFRQATCSEVTEPVLKRLVIPLLSCFALIVLSVGSASANTSQASSGWRDMLTLAPGQTTGTFTTAMSAELCASLLKAHPDRSRADCFTHHSLTLNMSQPKATARTDGLVLTAYSCRVSVAMSMWNWFWWADVQAYFCIDYGRYVYSYYVDCYSNFGAGPGQSISISWCGPGAAGTYADGGDIVWISGKYGSYMAGQRAGLTAWYSPRYSCWNAHC